MPKKGKTTAGKITQAKMLQAAVGLFLKNGFQQTPISEISKQAGLTTTAFFRSFADKEAILYALVPYVFAYQFHQSERYLGADHDPLMLYAVETVTQLYVTESIEALRDLYVSAYSLPTTSEYIHEKTTAKLEMIFQTYLPDTDSGTFYDLELASSGVMRSYMMRKCDFFFPMEKKIADFLTACLRIYKVPEKTIEQIIHAVQNMDLRPLADKVVNDTIAYVNESLENAIEELKQEKERSDPHGGTAK